MAEDEADPSTPGETPTFVPADVALPRIEAIVANARTVWLGQIGFLAFITLTLISTRDVDFFSVTATTDLPIINVAIPTTTFFWTAAWLAAILHTYLHLFLLRLWDALAEAPANLDGLRLGERVFPWLVNDLALRRRPDRPLETRPMDRLADTVTLALVWLGTPLVLVAFWWRSMPAHDAFLTLAIAGALGLSLFASATSWCRAQARLRRPGKLDGNSSDGTALSNIWLPAGIQVGAYLVAISLLSTEMEPARWRGLFLADIDLAGAEIAVRPDSWRDHELARRRFHITWCADKGVLPLVCEALRSEVSGEALLAWCNANPGADCAAKFRVLNAAFASEWAEERRAQLDNIVKPDLRNSDLRRATARGAFLVGIDLSKVRLEGADLSEARLEGANLSTAQLAGADLRGARLQEAQLFEARLDGTKLFEARLDGANLRRARLDRANLSRARLKGADLSEARLDWADLSEARLDWANLTRARLEEANLSRARLESANLSGARLEGANLTWARLDGADLSMARLEGADLIWVRLEGANLVEARLEGANLSSARLEGTNLSMARLKGANLTWAGVEGANLVKAGIQSANWAGATILASPAHSADFTAGKNLTQIQLAQVIGDDATILPRDAETGEQLYVWSCWEEVPERLEQLWIEHWEFTSEKVREYMTEWGWLCAEGEAPRKVGTPAEVAAPPAE